MKAVLFDLDGTLLNTLADLANAGNYALEQLGLPTHPIEAYRYFVGNGARKLCERMLPEEKRTKGFMEDAYRHFDQRYQAHMFDCTAPYPGIPELLSALKEKKLRLGVLSNKPDAFVQEIVERFFPGIFEAAAGQQGSRIKPDPAGINQILQQFGVPPEECLYVGDSGVDIQTAQNAHTHSCGVIWGFRGEPELREAGAEALAFSPSDILSLLEEENHPDEENVK